MVTSTLAVSLQGGVAYTAYAADFEIDPESVTSFSTPEIPADGNLLTIAVTVFNATKDFPPLEVGQQVEHTDEFDVVTFIVVHEHGETLYGTSTGAQGSVTITGVGDTFCAEIDYADEQKTLSGTIAASVKAL